MAEYIETGRQSAGDGFGPASPDNPSSSTSVDPLDNEENRALLAQLEMFWAEARDAHAQNRAEQLIDADYYDNNPWRAEDAQVLLDRGQAPLAFPLIKQVCDWVIGTERRTRIDWDVKPRLEDDVKAAQVKKEVLKFISDVNGSGFQRSDQFTDMVKVGIGWTEECYNNDKFEEPITHRHQDWKAMWWDPYSRDRILRDCRYLHRVKYTDCDYAVAMFPGRADQLKARACTTLDPGMEMLELETTLPQMFYGSVNPLTYGRSGTVSLWGNGTYRGNRPRVLLVETWFKKAVGTKLMVCDDDEYNGKRYDSSNSAMSAAVGNGTVSLVDSVSEEIWVALWTPGALLKVMRSPYKHNKYPFTPCWGYRRHRDGMPYGMVRPCRDSADEYNKRRSKILFDISTNRVKYEVDSMDEADEARNLEEAKRPDGEIRLKSGKIDAFVIEKQTDLAAAQINMLAEAKANIYEASGVTRENTGASTGDQSGRAILAKQQQGSVNTAQLFDNFRESIQESGTKTLANCEQFMSLPKVIRISGADGGLQWVRINQPAYDPATGQVLWENDITASEADFIVDQMDYRETVRMALSETLFEMIGRMDPQMGIQLLDIAVDLTDIPNKGELTKRIRAMNGQPAPGTEETPEMVAARQQQASEQQQQRDLATAETASKIRLNNAQADKHEADARKSTVEGKRAALDTAGLTAALLPLAPAADRLYRPEVNGAQPAPQQ